MKKSIISIILLFSYHLLNCQWVQTNGPEGGRILSLAIIDSYIYAGVTAGGGIFLSTDNGQNWTRKNNGMTNILTVNDIAIVGNNIFAATNKGLFISNDNGDNWMEANNSLTFSPEFGISCIEIRGSNIFVGSYMGVCLSTDNGNTWTAKNKGLKSLFITSIAISENIIVVGQLSGQSVQEDGVLLSTDNGNSWSPVNNGLLNRSVRSLTIDGSNIFAGTEGGLYISTNYGESWSLAYDIPNSYISGIGIIEGTVFAGTELGIFISKGNGTSWSLVNNGLINTNAFCFAGNEDYVFAGTDSGVFLTTNNGENWIGVNSGLVNISVQGITINKGKIFAGSYMNGIFQSSDEGVNWNKVNTDLTSTISTQELVSIGNNIFAILYMYNGLLVSNDNGESWKNISSKIPAKKIYEIAFKDTIIFAGTDAGLFVSTDNGEVWAKTFGYEKWTEYDVNWKNKNFPYFNCFTFSENKIITGTTKGVFLSTNNGESWEEADINLRNTIFMVFEKSESNIFAGTNKGIMKSTDDGKSWDLLYSFPDTLEMYITSMAIIGNNIFATRLGLYEKLTSEVILSKDNGESWREFISGFTTRKIGEILINGDKIYAATNQGVFKAQLSDFGITNVYEATNELQNYLYCNPPYPIPATNIVRSLIYWDSSIDIENDDIAVYDIFGNKVAGRERITIDKQNAYSGLLTWNCTNVPDGIYLIRIIHGTKTWTMKVIVSK